MKSNEEELINIAKTRGGYCLGLSNSVNHPTKYVWKCEKGHTWEAMAGNVKHGTWCPICNTNNHKKSIEEMRDLVRQHNGECLSQVYTNTHTRLTWKCSNGHIFEATPSKVRIGRACRYG